MLRCAAGRWPERTAGPATPRRSRDTWAGETSSTTRFPCSPPPTPIKSPAITRSWSQRLSPGAWPRYRTHEAGPAQDVAPLDELIRDLHEASPADRAGIAPGDPGLE